MKRLVHHCPPKDTWRMKGTECYCYLENRQYVNVLCELWCTYNSYLGVGIECKKYVNGSWILLKGPGTRGLLRRRIFHIHCVSPLIESLFKFLTKLKDLSKEPLGSKLGTYISCFHSLFHIHPSFTNEHACVSPFYKYPFKGIVKLDFFFIKS